MQNYRFFFSGFGLFLTVFVVWSCKGSAGTNSPVVARSGLQAADVIGRWSTVEMRVKIKSAGGNRGDSTVVLPVQELAARNKMKPEQQIFEANGKYREESISLQGEVMKEGSGYWHIYADSLYIRQNDISAGYGTERKGNKLIFRLQVDYDGDGQQDDLMQISMDKE